MGLFPILHVPKYFYLNRLYLPLLLFYLLTFYPTTGGPALTPELEDKMRKVVSFIEPINAKLEPIFLDDPFPMDQANYCIQQHLNLHLIQDYGEDPIPEGAYDDYFTATWDCDGNIGPSEGLLTFDDTEITFDSEIVDWSRIYK